MMELDEACRVIADYYGYTAQSNQLIEECAELIQALSKYRRAGSLKKQDALKNVIEEIGDVEIMLAQIKYLLKISEAELNIEKAHKLQRTIDRMEE